MLLSLFIWKGIWDVLERGIMDLFGSDIITYHRTIHFTLVIGYGIYFLNFILNKIIIYEIKRRNLDFKKVVFESNLLNLFYLFCFINLVTLWRTFFSGFDHLFLKHSNREFYILGSHFLIFVFMYSIGLGPALNGPARFDPDDFSPNEDEPIGFNELYQVIKISFFIT